MDVACGDAHSLAMTNAREVLVWGSNKSGQLGHDPEAYPLIVQPRKLILSEYMNSSKRETFSEIKACGFYSVLVSDSKHVYISRRHSEHPLMPLFGKSVNQGSRYTHMGVLRKLQDPALDMNCVLAFDQVRGLYYYQLDSKGKDEQWRNLS